MNEYYSVFGIRIFFMNEYYSVFGIRKFFMNEYIRYSVFGQIHYSVQLWFLLIRLVAYLWGCEQIIGMMLGLTKAKVSEISRESEYRMGKTRYKWEGAD